MSPAAGFGDADQGLPAGGKQIAVEEQILAAVAGDRELREQCQAHALCLERFEMLDVGAGIGGRVGEAHHWRHRGRTNEAEFRVVHDPF